MINWSEHFCLPNIEMVDTQHKKLFDLINKLTESYNKGGSSVITWLMMH